MLMLPSTVRVYVATGTTDLRRSIDGLAMLVRERLALDPLSGHLFLFRNRRGDRVKILAWDRSGFWVLYKRLERGTNAWRDLVRRSALAYDARVPIAPDTIDDLTTARALIASLQTELTRSERE